MDVATLNACAAAKLTCDLHFGDPVRYLTPKSGVPTSMVSAITKGLYANSIETKSKTFASYDLPAVANQQAIHDLEKAKAEAYAKTHGDESAHSLKR